MAQPSLPGVPVGLESRIEKLNTEFADEIMLEADEELSLLANAIVSNEPESGELKDEVLHALQAASVDLSSQLKLIIQNYDVRDIDY